jgi:hypothetical protein
MKKIQAWTKRTLFNLVPCYWSTGAKILHISHDYRFTRVKIPFGWRTRNMVGTLFGGSMYSATDPVYMTLFMRILGKRYLVWDKAATIRYKKPARGDLFADFTITEEAIQSILADLERESKVDRTFLVQLADAQGVVHAEIEKVLHFRKRE